MPDDSITLGCWVLGCLWVPATYVYTCATVVTACPSITILCPNQISLNGTTRFKYTCNYIGPRK